MQKITPFLWFDDQAEEAMNFYTSIFKNSKKGRIARYGDAEPGPKGTVMSAIFELDGQEFFPSILDKLLQDKDAEKSTRVMKAMMQMDKLDIKGREQAARRPRPPRTWSARPSID